MPPVVWDGRDSSSVGIRWCSTDMGQDGKGGHRDALPFRTGLELGGTLVALQREVLWPWRGLTPSTPPGAKGQPGKDPVECRGCSREGLRGDAPVAAKHWDVLVLEGRCPPGTDPVGMRGEGLIHPREPLPSWWSGSCWLADSPRTEGAGGGSGKTQRDASAMALEKGEASSVGMAAVGLPVRA